MNFNTLSFAVFFATVFSFYSLPLSWSTKKVGLLLASYLFYGWWNPYYLSLIVASSLIDMWAGQSIAVETDARRRRFFLIVSLVTNLGILGVFKYFNFFSASVTQALNSLGMQADPFTLNVLLPVGISFYTFQSMSYTIDIYRGKLEPVRSKLDFLLYVTFFPQLVAGPIVRATDFLPQLVTPRKLSFAKIQKAVYWIGTGYMMKVGVADNLASSVDLIYSAQSAVRPSEAWLATYYFAFQIFGDFCGYTLMARGTALLLGFEIPENFRAPYLAEGFSDFWRRWHISLSSWLRDYLYIPLGGNRGGEWQTYRNLALTMLLGGLWHGASWNFVIWGALHGLFLSLERALSSTLSTTNNLLTRIARSQSLPMRLLRIVLVFHAVCLCWVFFRAPDLATSWQLIATMFDFGHLFSLHMPHKALLKDGIWMVAIVGYFLAVFARERNYFDIQNQLPRYVTAVAFAAGLCITIFCREASDAFIYFQF